MDVLLALRLLGVGEAQVLPGPRLQHALTRLGLGQQARLDLVIRVYTNPEGKRPFLKCLEVKSSGYKMCLLLWFLHII